MLHWQEAAIVIGSTLGHYEILAPLGAGGMGEVYRARDTRLGRDVALKVLPAYLVADTERRQRFEREARAVAALDHPNIVTVYSIEEADGTHFITMQLVQGRTLAAVIPLRGLPLEDFLELALPIVDAVGAAHRRGIAHRDLKPGNIMVTDEGRPLILDFGLAKLIEAGPEDETVSAMAPVTLTVEGRIQGTAAYMSPEQAEGKPLDHRTDIFSLSIILYEMATGQRPFKGDTPISVISSIVKDTPSSLVDLNPALPPELARIVKLGLEKEPAHRYQSALDLRNELAALKRDFESGEILTSAPVAASNANPRWLMPALVAGILGLIVLLVISPAFFSSEAVPFVERDWILITDFENLTGEEVFDASLQTALTVSIDQSSYVNVLPRQRIEGALRRMRKADVQRVDAATAREIAARQNVKILLVPGISKVGDEYVLSAVIEDAATGRSLRSEIERAASQDDVLDALDQLTRRIREDLGEATASIERQGKSLAQVTTSSLEALKQYSLGVENLRNGVTEEAKTYFQNALRIDSDFTAARASLGMLEVDSARKGMRGFDAEEGKTLLAEAIEHIDDLSDGERFGILAFHAWAVEGDVQTAEEHYKALLALYPDSSVTHNNLGWLYSQTGRNQEALAEYEEAIRIDPHLMITHNGIAAIYLYAMGDLDAAIAACERQLAVDEEQAGAHDNLGWAYLGKGEWDRALAAFERARELNPRSTLVWWRIAHTERLLGRYAEAIETLDGIARIDPDDQSIGYNKGIVLELVGNDLAARERFDEFRAVAEQWAAEAPDDVIALVSLGLAQARLGETDQARATAVRALQASPSEHFSHAHLQAVLGNKQEALRHLEEAVDSGFTNYIWMKIHPDLIDLYDEPAFRDILARGLR